MDSTETLAQFLDIEANSNTPERGGKSNQQGKVTAYLFPNVLEKAKNVSGLFSLLVVVTVQKISLPDTFFPKLICSYLTRYLESILQRELAFIDGMVIPFVCNVAKVLTQIWEFIFPVHLNHIVWVSKKMEDKATHSFHMSA